MWDPSPAATRVVVFIVVLLRGLVVIRWDRFPTPGRHGRWCSRSSRSFPGQEWPLGSIPTPSAARTAVAVFISSSRAQDPPWGSIPDPSPARTWLLAVISRLLR